MGIEETYILLYNFLLYPQVVFLSSLGFFLSPVEFFLSLIIVFFQGCEWKRFEFVAFTTVEFSLEFDPMKTQGVEKSTQSFHHEEYECRCKGKNYESNQSDNYVVVPKNPLYLRKYES